MIPCRIYAQFVPIPPKNKKSPNFSKIRRFHHHYIAETGHVIDKGIFTSISTLRSFSTSIPKLPPCISAIMAISWHIR